MLRQSVGKIVATVQEKERLLTEDWQHSLFNVYLSRGKANVANPQTLWASFKPRRSAKANGLTSQSDRQKRKWSPETT